MTTEEYNGLYGEVVTHDTYRLKQLTFVPDIVFDLGGNVGIFARFAHELWPDAKIVSVEPHPSNIEAYKANTTGTTLIEAAIGKGQLYHNLGARNGSGEVYISKGLGYPDGGDEVSAIPTITIPELAKKYWKPGMRTILKMDIEGAENGVFTDPSSVKSLSKFDYLCFELHFYASTHAGVQEVSNKTMEVVNELCKTHKTLIENVHFWAWKR